MYDKNTEKQEEVEKLKLECQVVLTEKYAVKKELSRMDHLYSKGKKDLKENNIKFNLIADEVSVINKQNSDYRQTIL